MTEPDPAAAPADSSADSSVAAPAGGVSAARPPAEDGLLTVRAGRVVVRTAHALRVAWLRFVRDRGFEKAASLAYSSLLAIVPAALLAISVVELLDTGRKLAAADSVLSLIFPPEAGDIRSGILELLEESRQVFLEDGAGAGVRIFSLLILVYFAGKLLQSVDGVVSEIWGGGGFKRFLRRLSAYWAVVTLGPLLLALSFAATAVATDILGPAIGAFFASVLPFTVTWAAAYAFYRLMPHSKVRWQAALAGAVVAGSAWEGSKLLLGWYLARPKTFLTTLSFFPAALLWMYVSWVIAIFGLEVAYVVQHRSWRGGPRALPGPRDGAAREALALAAMVEIAAAFDEGRPPDRTELAERLHAAEDETADVVRTLVDSGFVTDDAGDLRPARGAAGIRAADVVSAVRGPAGTDHPAAGFLVRLARDGGNACASASVADLVRERASAASPTSSGRGDPPAGA